MTFQSPDLAHRDEEECRRPEGSSPHQENIPTLTGLLFSVCMILAADKVLSVTWLFYLQNILNQIPNSYLDSILKGKIDKDLFPLSGQGGAPNGAKGVQLFNLSLILSSLTLLFSNFSF